MPFPPGTRFGPYEITAPLGAGGMGEVYRARDTRLERTVAIKVLPPHLSQDETRRQRFEREARAISSLSHPGICALYDVGRQDTADGPVDYLVMEFLEGETLADRLAKGPLPIDQALRIAVDVATALDRAHRQGLVHRDLKPGNIMITREGTKLLDFGLAKAAAPAAAPPSGASATLTRTHPLTAEGTILGTVQYMAPEQLEGEEADARADIFALGAVLYEMATGRRAFEGKSQASLVAAILAAEPPPIAALQPLAPAALDRVVRLCLAKDPDARWQTAHDLALALRWVAEGGPPAGVAAPAAAPRRRAGDVLWKAAALLLAIAAGGLAVPYVTRKPEVRHPVRSSVLPPEGSRFEFEGIGSGPVALSPDGRQIAFVAPTTEGRYLLWVRSLETAVSRSLEGTEGASYPFWSPDSRSIGFFAESKLKRISAGGGPPQSLCEVSTARGGAWGPDGTILFAPDVNDTIYRVAETGGTPAAATAFEVGQRQSSHRWPCFLPDGRHFIYFNRAFSSEGNAAYVGSLDSKGATFLMNSESNVLYAPPGYLLYVRDRALMAQPFDARRLVTTGEAVPLAEPVRVNRAVFHSVVSASANGVLAYQEGTIETGWKLQWCDRAGKVVGGGGESMTYLYPRISPDGKRIAVQVNDGGTGNADIWIFDAPGGARSRFTFDPTVETTPVWSPDGARIAYSSNRRGRFGVYVKATSNLGADEPLVEEQTSSDARPLSWSRDGRYLAFMRRTVSGPTHSDIWILPLFGDRKAFPFVETPFEDSNAAFSPDDHFIAYESNESGRFEIYAAPFPATGGKWQVSVSGGTIPRWRGDGQELYYIAPDNKVMAVEIRHEGPNLSAGAPRPLFQAHPVQGAGGAFDVSADGTRFLFPTEAEHAEKQPVTLVVDWAADLPR